MIRPRADSVVVGLPKAKPQEGSIPTVPPRRPGLGGRPERELQFGAAFPQQQLRWRRWCPGALRMPLRRTLFSSKCREKRNGRYCTHRVGQFLQSQSAMYILGYLALVVVPCSRTFGIPVPCPLFNANRWSQALAAGLEQNRGLRGFHLSKMDSSLWHGCCPNDAIGHQAPRQRWAATVRPVEESLFHNLEFELNTWFCAHEVSTCIRMRKTSSEISLRLGAGQPGT